MLQGSILQKLETAHQGGERPLNFGVYYKNTLVALCHALEDFILDSEGSPVVIAAFQQGKWYLQEAERYAGLAAKSSHISILAAPEGGFKDHPTSKKDNVSLVELDRDDPVAQEWHLMIFSPEYTAMVLCQELSAADYRTLGQPENDLERKFYGFWTFEPKLVRETVELTVAHIAQYDQELAKELSTQVEGIAAKLESQEVYAPGKVVSRIVDYLQDNQNDLAQPLSIHFSENLDENLVSNEMQAFLRMAQLIDLADTTNPMAAAEVAALAETMGQMLDLPAWQVKRIRLAGLLHGIVPSLLLEGGEGPSCLLDPGVQALRTMPQLRAVAKIITHQKERWDGKGEPAGLGYDAIPLESRIINLVREFQHQVGQISQDRGKQATLKREETLVQALEACQKQAGEAFDPKLVDALSLMVMGMQQGMSIKASPPKISAGMWLLDEHTREEAEGEYVQGHTSSVS